MDMLVVQPQDILHAVGSLVVIYQVIIKLIAQ